MKAVILAGGLGRRIREIAQRKPTAEIDGLCPGLTPDRLDVAVDRIGKFFGQGC